MEMVVYGSASEEPFSAGVFEVADLKDDTE
jgi:hypothetical protein